MNTPIPPPRLVPDRPSDAAIAQAAREQYEKNGTFLHYHLLIRRACEIDAAAPPAEAPALFSERHGVDLRSIKVGEVLTQAQWDAVCAFVREQEAIIESAKLAAAPADELPIEQWPEWVKLAVRCANEAGRLAGRAEAAPANAREVICDKDLLAAAVELRLIIMDAIKIHSSFNTTADMADWLRDNLAALATFAEGADG